MASLRFLLAALAAAPLVGVFAGACVPGTGPALLPDDAAPPLTGFNSDASTPLGDADLGDPFTLTGLTPSHGPFTGGTRTQLDGRGFTSKLRVFIGGAEIDPGAILASDPTRAAVVTPPGPPGFVDVKIRDDATAQERTLTNGFFYDAFVVTPSSGATSGGTRVAIQGLGTTWGAGTTVQVAGVDCTSVTVQSPTNLTCVTPAGTPGSKDVVVTPANGTPIQVRDAFTYSDSTDGYRGGLSGGALAGTLKVLAIDSFLGSAIPGAYVVVGTNVATATIGKTSATGAVEFDNLDPTATKVTVTVAAKCHSPMTYVDVPVDTVTFYIDPVIDPACIQGDPQPIPGGPGIEGGFVSGQVVFPGGSQEFQRANWTTVPTPTKPTERKAAYAFEASSTPDSVFQLPDADQAITPETDGDVGYQYSLLTFPGNTTVYIVAGLEDRSVSPPSFVPYAMGIQRGISVPADGRIDSVDVKLDILFDHETDIGVNPPAPGPRGPDQLTTSVAVTLGSAGYAILPRGTRTSPLPAPATIPFVGLPSLGGGLAKEEYVIGGIAATTAAQVLPASVVSHFRTTDADGPVSLGGFLGVPVLQAPGAGIWDGSHVTFKAATGAVDLTVTTVSSAAGLVSWTIVAPGTNADFDLPDLEALEAQVKSPDSLGLVHGTISTIVYAARIDDFQYATVRTGQLSTGGWNAYAADSLDGVY